MPRTADYSTTVIYKITCNDPNITDKYVGHTTDLVRRRQEHKNNTCNENSPQYNIKLYKFIRDNGGWDNWKMEVVNFYNCINLSEARQNEQDHYVELNASLNSMEPLSAKQIAEDEVVSQRSEYIEMFPKNPTAYVCKECDFTCSKTNDWNRHLLTAKHKKNTNSDDTISKVFAGYSCEKCDYKCYKQTLWNKHVATAKHRKESSSESKLCCDKCNKTYKCYSSLWSHKRSCNPDKSIVLINKLFDKNLELQNFILEQSRQNHVEYKNDINQIMLKLIEATKSTTNAITANTNFATIL